MLSKLTAISNRLPNGVTRKIGSMALSGKRHTPGVLFAVGVVGVVTTVVLASRATLKVDEILTESEKKQIEIEAAFSGSADFDEADLKKDMFTLRVQTAAQIARLYTPALMVGVVSICALTGSHIILNRRNFGLTAAYAGMEKAFSEYRKRIADEYGVEKEAEHYHGVETHKVTETLSDGSKVEKEVKIMKGTHSPYARIFDQVNSSDWSPESIRNRTFIQCQQNYANDQLRTNGYVFLNQVYKMLGMSETLEGQVVGWLWDADRDKTGDGYIDFGVFSANSPHQSEQWINGNAPGIYLDFNVDGNILDKFQKKTLR